MIDKNINFIKTKIKTAAARSGQDQDKIELIAVTKTVGLQEICRVAESGVKNIGENRVPDAAFKKEALKGRLSPDIRWHMIGHLQTNKVKQAVRIFDMIQSVDSLRLSREIDKRAAQMDKFMPVLLEVNVSGEEVKFGFEPEVLLKDIGRIALLPNIKIKGLMTMAPLTDDTAAIRPVFQGLKNLSQKINDKNICSVDMQYLSMGMSQDYEIAVEEGANMVRIGSAIFL